MNPDYSFLQNIVEMTLKHNATSVILAHNHSCGLQEPSDFDVVMIRI
ncbi:MAG: hypothetical protein HZC10_08465 [Nitrospirae bacterium]|nr:hypothetical protein [Nitrospirota bacterium]